MVCLNSKKYGAYNENNDMLKRAKKGSNRNISDLLEIFYFLARFISQQNSEQF